MGLKVVWSAERKYAPGSFVPSCRSRLSRPFGLGGDAYRHKDVHRAGQGRQQRIVCVKDDEMNKQQPIAG